AKKRGYSSTIERLHKFGILGKQSIAAHCIHLEEKDFNILKDTKTTVIHNPYSNANNAVGMAPVLKLLDKNIMLGLGSDGWTDGMLRELRNSIMISRLR